MVVMGILVEGIHWRRQDKIWWTDTSWQYSIKES